nr:MAG TPA: hypothetical protein [Caudoviricetes sp.]
MSRSCTVHCPEDFYYLNWTTKTHPNYAVGFSPPRFRFP